MFDNIDFAKIPKVLSYDPQAPMLFSSGLFLFLFLGFLLIYMLLQHKTKWRIFYVTLFSIYFYYKSSGLWFALLLFTATSDFLIGRQIFRTMSQPWRKALVTLSLCVNLGMLSYFKYFNFLLNALSGFGQEIGRWFSIPALEGLSYTPMDIFLPVGISFFTFQSISYVIDIYRKRIDPLRRWIDYVFYVSFFPQLVAGPIVRARDFIPQMFKDPQVSRLEFGEGLFLIVCGLFKKRLFPIT